ncbi:flagellin [Planctomycetales bacterium]|nr:flagellin [Planctomycetales bacterium]
MFLNSMGDGGNSRNGLGGFNVGVLGNMRSLGSSLEKTLYAISTGYRVNRAADDPSASVAIARADTNLNSLGVAIDNNQRSFNELTGVDGAQKGILGVLQEIRNNAQRLNGETDPTLRQTLVETVAAQLQAIDTLAHSVSMGGKTALNGASQISLGSNAARALDAKGTVVRTVRDDAYLSIAFDNKNAASQARVAGNYAAPTVGASAFMITTQSGTKSVQLSAGVSDGDALKQINKTLAGIGARAEIYTDDGGAKQIAFYTDGYGKGYNIEYKNISDGVLGAAASRAAGATGQVRINAENYALFGDYNNYAAENAVVSGKADLAYDGTTTTDLNFKTANGTASLASFTAASIQAAIEAINNNDDVKKLGVRAELTDGELKFSTDEAGVGAALEFSDSAGALFASRIQQAAVTGRDYRPGDGLRVNYVKPEMTAALVFDYDKVTTARSGGVEYPADDFAFTTQARGGVNFYTGDGAGFYDSIRYGFADLTSSGLGLSQLMNDHSSLSLDKHPATALSFIDSTIAKVQTEYGALGSFMNYQLDRTTQVLQALESSTADGRSILADADMAEETLKVVRYQILQQAGMSALSANANYAQMVTSLLSVGTK